MPEPFEDKRPASGVDRLLRGRARGEAMRNLEGALARADCLSDVSEEQLGEVLEGFSLGVERLHTGCVRLYRRYLEHCLVDQTVSDEEATELLHLRRILRLEPDAVARVHRDVAHQVYGRAIEQVLEDQRLDPEEEHFLKRLREDLELPEDEADRLFQKGAERARHRFIGKHLSQDPFVAQPRDYVLELTGTSATGLEDAVCSTLEQARRAIPGIYWLELKQIGMEPDGANVGLWHVKIAAHRRDDENAG